MKKVITCLLMTFCCINIFAEQDAKDYKTFVKDDHHVYYCSYHGICVIVDPTAGGLFEPHITIINNSGHDFVFEPKMIKAFAYAAPYNTSKDTRYRVDMYLERGGDASKLEQDELTIYSPEKYMKKSNRAHWWGNLLAETVIAGVEAIGPQDAQTRYFNQERREDRMKEADTERQQEMKRISEGYWRANTIFNHSEHNGFIAIKPIKSSYLILDIPIENENFHFVIDNKKH